MTVTLVNVQGGFVPGWHSFTAVPDAENEEPVEAVSLVSGLIVCVTPLPPVEVSAVAAVTRLYLPLTTEAPPILTAEVFEVARPPDAVVVPEPPVATVEDATSALGAFEKRTL